MMKKMSGIYKSFLLLLIVGVISSASGYILLEITNIPELLIAMISSFLGLTIVSLAVLVDKDADLIKTMGHTSMIKSIAIGIVIFITSILILNIIPIEQGTTTNELLEPTEIGRNITIIYSVIIAPVIEELFFRATLREIIENDIDYIVISSILFAILHVGSFDISGLMHFISSFASGAILSYLYVKSQDIFSPMLAHATSNFMVFFITSL